MSDLPAGWLETTLGEVVDYGKTEKVEPKNIPANAWILELEDIEKDTSRLLQRLTIEQRESKSTKNAFQKGDVLYGKLRPYLNKVIMADDDGFCTTEIIPIKPNTSIDGRYLFYWLKTPEFLSYVNSVSYGLNMPRLGTKDGLAAPLVLAPLDEQKRIAEKLDSLLTRVDSCQSHLERVPQILNRFRQSVLAAATSGRLTGNDENDDAQHLPLSEVIERLKTGPFGSALHKADYISNGIPLVNPMHINDGRITPSNDMTISKQKAKELKEFLLTRGDIVLARRGVMGRCAVVGEKEDGWLCGSGSMLLHPTDKLLPEYLQIFLSSPETVANLEADSVGSTMSNLNQKILLALVIRVPSLEEQAEIVRRVESLFAYAERLEARYLSASERVARLTPSLLAKAFRGELVEQEVNDEG